MTETGQLTAQDVKQAVQDALTQAGAQIADQVAQQVGQSVSQAIQKLLQSTGTTFQQATGAATVGQEIGDVGGTENIEADLVSKDKAWFANSKRTYDEYQHESLESIRRNRSYVDKVLSDAATHDNRVRAIAEQALQNAVETSNMVGKQALRHGDIAIDNEWNPVQQGAGDTLTARAVSIDDASLKAIGAAVAAAVVDALKPKA